MFCFLLIVNTVFYWNMVYLELLAYKIFQVLIFFILSARTRTFSPISELLYNFLFFIIFSFFPLIFVKSIWYIFQLFCPFTIKSLAKSLDGQRLLLDDIWTYTVFFIFNIVHIFSRLFNYSHRCYFGLLFIRYGS